MGSKPVNIKGFRFGKLIAIRFVGKANGGKRVWEFKCDCGSVVFRKQTDVMMSVNKGRSVSCGCKRVHGFSRRGNKSELYKKWCSIKSRCYNKNNIAYERYGALGVDMCQEWKNDFNKFNDWALSNGFSSGLSIDRIDPTRGYSPDNCQFMTVSENSRKRWTDKVQCQTL